MMTEATIAIVDDDIALRNSLGDLMLSAGYHVALFESARALIDSSDLGTVALVISDVEMPEMDGFELTRQLELRNVDVPLILITAKPGSRASLPAGCRLVRCVLTKPFVPDDLFSWIETSIHDGRM